MDINVEPAWEITQGEGVKVAVYDDGFDMTHPDLVGNVHGTGFDVITGTSPSVINWPGMGHHASPVVGIIGAVQNNIGVSGVAPESKLISISADLYNPTAIQIQDGLSWAWQNGSDIINCSWGYWGDFATVYDALSEAMTLGRNGKGSVVVFCAGNKSPTETTDEIWTSSTLIPELIVVGAISQCGQRKTHTPNASCDGETYWSSRFGSTLDVMAPGVKIYTTDRAGLTANYPGDYWPDFRGTSAAAPFVSGVAALILSINPCLTVKQVGDIIEQTAQKIRSDLYDYTTTAGRPNGTWNPEMGYGLVDAHAAVVMAQNMYSPTLDLYVKDSPADLGIEPNIVTPYVWTSDDIWVRNQQDDVAEHQNPIYDPATPNYVCVRVINKSCVASTGTEQLTLHWAKASSALSWPSPWAGGVTYPETGASMGAFLGMQNIPVIQPGEEAIIKFPWMVPNPAQYGGDDPWHFCLLTKIVSSQDPMTFPEVNNSLTANVANNNNIAWKNITVITIDPEQSENEIGGMIATGNPLTNATQYTLTFKAEDRETGKKIFEDAEVTITLDENLFEAWDNGGRHFVNMKTTKEDNKLIITGDEAVLTNLLFDAKQIGTLGVRFNFLTKEITDKQEYIYHVIQKDNQGAVFGGETYKIQKYPRTPFYADAGGDKETDLNQPITITAEDINEPAEYNWYDNEGNLIYQGKELQIANAVADKYKLEVISTADGFKDYTEVEVTIKPSTLDVIAPNPAINTVTVAYKLNEVTSAYLMIIGYYGNNETSNNYILDVNSSETTLDISNYPTGFYTVALVCDGEIIDAKTLIKQ